MDMVFLHLFTSTNSVAILTSSALEDNSNYSHIVFNCRCCLLRRLVRKNCTVLVLHTMPNINSVSEEDR